MPNVSSVTCIERVNSVCILVQDHNRERGLVGDAKPCLPEAARALSAPMRGSPPLLGAHPRNSEITDIDSTPPSLTSLDPCTVVSTV